MLITLNYFEQCCGTTVVPGGVRRMCYKCNLISKILFFKCHKSKCVSGSGNIVLVHSCEDSGVITYNSVVVVE